MLIRYKVGDIVEGLNFTGVYSILNGKTGVVKYFELTPGTSWVCVEWSIVFGYGHSGDGRGKEGRCRNFIGTEKRPNRNSSSRENKLKYNPN